MKDWLKEFAKARGSIKNHRNFTSGEILRYIHIVESGFKTSDLYTSYIDNYIVGPVKAKSLIVASKEDFVRSLDIKI